MILKSELHHIHLLDLLLLYVIFKTLKMSTLAFESLYTAQFSALSPCCPKGDIYLSHENGDLILAFKGL